jgi:hypothetical protein
MTEPYFTPLQLAGAMQIAAAAQQRASLRTPASASMSR